MTERRLPEQAPRVLPEVPEAPAEFLSFMAQQRGQPKPSIEQPIPQCEKLIFVSVPTEVSALEFAALGLGIQFRRCRDKTKKLEYFDLGRVGTDRVIAVRTTMGPLSVTGSAALAIQYRSQTGANAIISLGMAFGALPKAQRIGQVLVATGVLPYDNKTVRTGPSEEPLISYDEVRVYPSNPELLGRFRRAADSPEWKGRVMSGLFLSGGARIHCASFREELARECSRGRGDLVVGGDMEGVGFLSASDEKRPCWIVVKAISDFADRDRDEIIERARPVACWNAARFVLITLQTNEVDHDHAG
jgi:adenosylhomocysteine nucleosidase